MRQKKNLSFLKGKTIITLRN